MLVKTEGIVLQNIKYADKKLISKIYTRHYGLLTAHVVTGSAPSSKIKTSSILPLNQVEITLVFKANRDVQQLTEVRNTYIYDAIHRDFNKMAIAQFINEVLVKCLREHTANDPLFDFITASYRWLDEKEHESSNFHIYVLFELTRFLGFEPNNNCDERNLYFDTREGKFSEHALSFPLGLDKQQSQLFLKLFEGNNLEIKLNRSERTELLECLLAYYKMHVSGFNELRSLPVLKDLFTA